MPYLINSLSPWVTLGVAQQDLGGIQSISRRNEWSAPGSKAASFHTFLTLQGKGEAGILNHRPHSLREEWFVVWGKRQMFVALKMGGRGATCLHCYSLHFNYKLKPLFLNKGNTSQFSCFCGCRSYLASFSSSAIRMVIKLLKVSPKIFENHKPIQSRGFFYVIPPLPTPLSSSHLHPTPILFLLL